MNTQTKTKGFTIIEVVLVLAIAALIFLMIFIALPALQKGQRDTGRKQDANAVAAALNSYRSNKSGRLPNADTFEAFKNSYVKNLSQYGLDEVKIDDKVDDKQDFVAVQLGANCDGESSTRAAAVRVRLEGSNDTICTDA